MRLLTYIYGGNGGYLEAALKGNFRVWEDEPVRHARLTKAPDVSWVAPAPGTSIRDTVAFIREAGALAREDPRLSHAVLAENIPGTGSDAGLIGFLASLMSSGYVLELVLVSPPGDNRLVRVAEVCQESVTWIDASLAPLSVAERLRGLRGIRRAFP